MSETKERCGFTGCHMPYVEGADHVRIHNWGVPTHKAQRPRRVTSVMPPAPAPPPEAAPGDLALVEEGERLMREEQEAEAICGPTHDGVCCLRQSETSYAHLRWLSRNADTLLALARRGAEKGEGR